MKKIKKLKDNKYLSTETIVHGNKQLSKILDAKEIIENENGTAIKYSNGTMKCFGNVALDNVNFSTSYGNVFLENIGSRCITFPASFKDTAFSINVYVKSLGGGIGGVCGSDYNKNGAYYYLWHTRQYDFGNKKIVISYEAKGRWK